MLSILYKILRRKIHSWWRSPAWDEAMARQLERVDEDTAMGPRFGQDPPPISNTGVHIPTIETRSSTLAGNLIVAEGRTAAEVVMDDALVQDDGIDLIVEELDRCWEVTQDQDKASKIEKALYGTRRDVKMETPSCPMWHDGSLIFNNWKMHWGRHYQQRSRVTRHYETRNLPKAATTRW